MALPAGWCATSIVKDLSCSFDLELRKALLPGCTSARVDHLQFFVTWDPLSATELDNDDLWDGSPSTFGFSATTVFAEMYNEFTGITTALAGISGAGSATGDPGMLPAIPIEKTSGTPHQLYRLTASMYLIIPIPNM